MHDVEICQISKNSNKIAGSSKFLNIWHISSIQLLEIIQSHALA